MRHLRALLPILLPAVLSALLQAPAQAQAPTRAQAPAGTPPGTGESFLIEAAGGAVGSLAGLWLGVGLGGVGECGVENLECMLKGAAVALVGSAAGAGIGAWGAGRWRETEPSGWGAAVGGVAGLAAALGVVRILEESSPRGGEGVGAIVAHGVTHGLVTALFTRIF